jgi:hypothetical protein
VRVRNFAERETLEIDTPQAAFSLLTPGEYRIDVDEQGDATIATVRGGEAEAASDGRTFRIHARDQVRVTEEGDRPVFDRRAVPVADAFDNWCQDRDRREDRSESARRMSRDIPGYADLDDHGVWREEQQYAWIWMPRVSPGWAPYRYGHWAWIEPWGWTWVDDAPWGYAPFHYGRWIFIGGMWGWVPGPIVVRPVFCPALVAWVGGPHFSIGISIGGPPVGWFPLGPREVWVPPYHHSRGYIERVNVTNTVIVNRTVINNVNVNYVNRGVAGAVTAVPRDVLMSGRPVGGAAVRVPADVAARGEVGAVAPVVPQRGALLDGRSAAGPAPPAAVINRRIVARENPPPPPVSFAQRLPALQADPGRPLDRATNNQMQRTQPPSSRPAYRRASPPYPSLPSPAPATRGGQPPVVSRPAPQPDTGRQQGGSQQRGQQGGGQPGTDRDRRGAPPPGQPQISPRQETRPQPPTRPESSGPSARPEPQPRPESSPRLARPRPEAQQPQVQRVPQPAAEQPRGQRPPQPPPQQQVQPQPQPEAGRPRPPVRQGGSPERSDQRRAPNRDDKRE